MTDNPSPSLRFLRMADTLKRVGILSRSTIYKMMAEGNFPRCVPLTGNGSIAFIESEIEQWMASRIQARDLQAVNQAGITPEVAAPVVKRGRGRPRNLAAKAVLGAGRLSDQGARSPSNTPYCNSFKTIINFSHSLNSIMEFSGDCPP